jgi:hypothetical protein
MPRRIVLLALLIAVTPAGNGAAADLSGTRATPRAVLALRGQPLPFQRGERAEAVWASGACWRDCQSYCTWGEIGCLEVNAQGLCLTLTDRCDRFCQRECRTRGGPLVAPLLGLVD